MILKRDPGGDRRKPPFACAVAGLVVLSLAGWNHASDAAAADPRTIGGFQVPLPVVPLQTPPYPADAMPLVDSLRGNEAAMDVIVGQGRLLTLGTSLAGPQGAAVVAVGDPSVLDFALLPNPRMIRLIGKRVGVTDLSVIASDGQTLQLEVHVMYDLELLRMQLGQVFPDAQLRLAQLREQLIVEGQARNATRMCQIVETLEGYLTSAQPMPSREALSRPRLINLIRVPDVPQVMLQVRIAEVNRTSRHEAGGSTLVAPGLLDFPAFVSNTSMVFGLFTTADCDSQISTLCSSAVLSILAEPSLIALSGHHATFLAGGQVPVPVPQLNGGMVEFKDIGVQLDIVPYVLDEGIIRLAVTPEVSSIDCVPGGTSVAGGIPVPGLNTHRAMTTVELRQGQTLVIAGLKQVSITAETSRASGLGSLPVFGRCFGNFSHISQKRVEKELLVLITPCLVSPMPPDAIGQ